jgi:hypothetical protein
VRENKPLNSIKHSCTPPAKSKTLAKVCEGVSDVLEAVLRGQAQDAAQSCGRKEYKLENCMEAFLSRE